MYAVLYQGSAFLAYLYRELYKISTWRQCNFVIVRHFCNKILDQFVGICMHNLIECFKLTNMCALIVSSIMVTLRKILQLDGQLLIECR